MIPPCIFLCKQGTPYEKIGSRIKNFLVLKEKKNTSIAPPVRHKCHACRPSFAPWPHVLPVCCRVPANVTSLPLRRIILGSLFRSMTACVASLFSCSFQRKPMGSFIGWLTLKESDRVERVFVLFPLALSVSFFAINRIGYSKHFLMVNVRLILEPRLEPT